MRSIRDAALAFDRACQAAGVRYALVGGFAVMAWGQPRATTDVDALVELASARLRSFAACLEAENFSVQPHDLVGSSTSGRHVSVFDKDSSYHVDVKPALTEDELREISAAIAVDFDDGRLCIAAPEETIAYKLLFGSEQDEKDARSILARQRQRLDWVRLERVAARLGVEASLVRLRRQVDESYDAADDQ